MRYLKGIILFAVVVVLLSVSAVSIAGVKTKIEIKALENPDGSVVFYGETNLPDGTILDIWWMGTRVWLLKNGGKVYPFSGNTEVTVKDGQYRTDLMWEDKRVLPGQIKVNVSADEYSDKTPEKILTALKSYSTLGASKKIKLKQTELRVKADENRLAKVKNDIQIVNEIAAETKKLYEELMVFKNTRKFREAGVSAFRSWFDQADALREDTYKRQFIRYKGATGPWFLFGLGLEYVCSEGEETENTILFRQQIEKSIKGKVELVIQ